MTPKDKKNELEAKINGLIQNYEAESGLEIESAFFWRDHHKIPTVSFTVKVPK